MKRRRAVWLALVGGALIPAACSSTGVVGGSCRTGLLQCHGQCVSPTTYAQECGCSGCVGSGCNALCGQNPDAGRDADASDGPNDGSGDRTRPDGSGGDSGDASNCKPPFNTPQHCGNCQTACTGTSGICSPSDGGYACVPLCTPPLVQCGTQCVDLNSDPQNCGHCGHACPTGLCQGGTCVGAGFGHIVLACMNFEQTGRNAQPTVLLGNAVFLPLPQHDPVRILAYDEFASSGVATKVDTTIGWAATARNRTFQLSRISNGADVPTTLSILEYRVFLVYDQPNAPSGALGNDGNLWQQTLNAFVRAGGTVIVLDGADGVDQMPDLLTKADLLSVTGDTNVSGSELYNRAPTDAIGLNVLSPFLAYQLSCTFTTSVTPSSTTAFVVTNSPPDAGLGAPVVVHRTQAP